MDADALAEFHDLTEGKDYSRRTRVAFNPNARDPDQDRKVQEGTVHERVAGPRKPTVKPKPTDKPDKPKAPQKLMMAVRELEDEVTEVTSKVQDTARAGGAKTAARIDTLTPTKVKEYGTALAANTNVDLVEFTGIVTRLQEHAQGFISGGHAEAVGQAAQHGAQRVAEHGAEGLSAGIALLLTILEVLAEILHIATEIRHKRKEQREFEEAERKVRLGWLEVKARGRYNPRARDADLDRIVQEGTPFARPAMARKPRRKPTEAELLAESERSEAEAMARVERDLERDDPLQAHQDEWEAAMRRGAGRGTQPPLWINPFGEDWDDDDDAPEDDDSMAGAQGFTPRRGGKPRGHHGGPQGGDPEYEAEVRKRKPYTPKQKQARADARMTVQFWFADHPAEGLAGWYEANPEGSTTGDEEYDEAFNTAVTDYDREIGRNAPETWKPPIRRYTTARYGIPPDPLAVMSADQVTWEFKRRSARGRGIAYNPDAVDADRDMMVQEGTPFARPYTPRADDRRHRDVAATNRRLAEGAARSGLQRIASQGADSPVDPLAGLDRRQRRLASGHKPRRSSAEMDELKQRPLRDDDFNPGVNFDELTDVMGLKGDAERDNFLYWLTEDGGDDAYWHMNDMAHHPTVGDILPPLMRAYQRSRDSAAERGNPYPFADRFDAQPSQRRSKRPRMAGTDTMVEPDLDPDADWDPDAVIEAMGLRSSDNDDLTRDLASQGFNSIQIGFMHDDVAAMTPEQRGKYLASWQQSMAGEVNPRKRVDHPFMRQADHDGKVAAGMAAPAAPARRSQAAFVHPESDTEAAAARAAIRARREQERALRPIASMGDDEPLTPLWSPAFQRRHREDRARRREIAEDLFAGGLITQAQLTQARLQSPLHHETHQERQDRRRRTGRAMRELNELMRTDPAYASAGDDEMVDRVAAAGSMLDAALAGVVRSNRRDPGSGTNVGTGGKPRVLATPKAGKTPKAPKKPKAPAGTGPEVRIMRNYPKPDWIMRYRDGDVLRSVRIPDVGRSDDYAAALAAAQEHTDLLPADANIIETEPVQMATAVNPWERPGAERFTPAGFPPGLEITKIPANVDVTGSAKRPYDVFEVDVDDAYVGAFTPHKGGYIIYPPSINPGQRGTGYPPSTIYDDPADAIAELMSIARGLSPQPGNPFLTGLLAGPPPTAPGVRIDPVTGLALPPSEVMDITIPIPKDMNEIKAAVADLKAEFAALTSGSKYFPGGARNANGVTMPSQIALDREMKLRAIGAGIDNIVKADPKYITARDDDDAAYVQFDKTGSRTDRQAWWDANAKKRRIYAELTRKQMALIRPMGPQGDPAKHDNLEPVGYKGKGANAHAVPIDPQEQADVDAAIAKALEYYPTDWLDTFHQWDVKIGVDKSLGPGTGGYFFPTGHHQAEIHLADPKPATVAHEVGHGMERSRRVLAQAEWTFIMRRSRGETAGIDMSYPNGLTYPDEWMDGYVGHTYADPAAPGYYAENWEAFTRGMEWVSGWGKMMGSIRDDRADPDFRAFLLGTLAVM